MTDELQSTPTPRRRWLSYGLRGLMVLVLLLSLPMGWIARDVYRAQQEAEAVTAVENAGGYASYPYQQLSGWREEPKLPGPWILRKLFGDHIHAYVDHIVVGDPEDINEMIPKLACCRRIKYLQLYRDVLNDESIEVIAQFTKLNELVLNGTTLTPKQLRQLSTLPSLKSITLPGPCASDKHLQQLPHFSNLEKVKLQYTTVTDRGMQSLGQLPKLTWLEIKQAPAVTNHGFAALKSCQKLTHVWLAGTKVDDRGIESLKSLPEADDVYIDPDGLEVEFQNRGVMRLDTLTPVQVKNRSGGSGGTAGSKTAEKAGTRIIDIDDLGITLKRYDEEDIIDLPQSPENDASQ